MTAGTTAQQHGQRDVPGWLQETAQKLSSLPEEIETAFTELHKLNQELDAAVEILKDREHEIFEEVCNAKDPVSGKALFSNEQLRSGETSKRLKTDEQGAALREKIKTLRDTIGLKRVAADKLSNVFSSTKHRADLYSGWLRTQAK